MYLYHNYVYKIQTHGCCTNTLKEEESSLNNVGSHLFLVKY